MLSKEEKIKYAKKIKPVLRVKKDGTRVMTEDGSFNKSGKLYYIQPVDIKTQAFTWDPRVIYSEKPEGLVKVTDIYTLHFDSHFFFKPSVEEVLDNIPGTILDKIDAFELYSADLTPNSEGTVRAKVRLYSFKEGYKHPDSIAEQKVTYDGVEQDL